MLRPKSGIHQWIARESYTLNPSIVAVEYTDSFGNLCQRLVAPAGSFSIQTSADIMTESEISESPGAPFVAVENLPDEVLTYLLPTRYCESDKFLALGQEIVTGARPGYDQVVAIVEWVRQHIKFNPLASQFQLSATEVHQQGEGVCRDLAHVAIAICRGLCIPARLVVGYLYKLEPMDFHAWFEAFVGGKWYTFDPTQKKAVGGRVTVACGRDAADVAIFTQFGPALYPQQMSVDVELLASKTSL